MSNKRDDLEFSFGSAKGDDEIRFELDDETSQLLELIKQLEQKKEAEAYAGWKRWFVPGTPYGIENLPKHAAFLFAGKNNHETYFSAANRCFAEGTLVATPRGPVAIEDICIGDIVYDCYGEETVVVNTMFNGEREVVDLVNRGKVYATCTPDHEFDAVYLPKGATFENGKGVRKRIRADELKSQRVVRRQSVVSPLGAVSEKWAYALGALLGDGCSTVGTRNNIVISSGDDLVPSRVAEDIGARCSRAHQSNYNWKLSIPHSEIHSLYYQWCFNRKAHEKIVDLDVLKTWSRKSVLLFVAGLIDTDGSLNRGRDGHSLCLTSQSPSIIAAFKWCVLALWNELVTVSVDSREKYVNGPCFSAVVRNPHKLRTICDELRPYLSHKYKATLDEECFGGKRSFKDGIKLQVNWDSLRVTKVYDITVAHDEHFFLLANGLSVSNCGKSLSGAFQTALHLLGDYPDWWEGKTWDRPTDGWAVGDSKETVRDIIQKELLGDVGRLGTGMIPADRIEKVVYRPNSGGAVDYVLVRHKSGGLSRLGFKSSEQGIQSFYGTAKDFVWLDELPAADIYSECFLRTMTTNGIIYVTATPLAGLTPLVLNFYNTGTFLPEGSELPGIVKLSREDDEESQKERLRKGEIDEIKKDSSSKAVIVAGWDDAPWLSEDAKRRMLDATPDHLKEARSKGLPSMGSGTIYTIPLEEVLVKDFDIPDHWKRICGMDVGWNNTAAIWLAENPDTKQVYAYSEYKRGNAEPVVHAAAIKNRGDWIPIAIDPASRGRSQVDGKQLFNLYRELGLKLFPADNAVEAGIYRVQEMLATGRLKFFRSLSELAKEYVVYRRNEKGKVIKEMDHLLDALRYAVVGVNHARQKPITNSFNEGGISTYGSRQYDI